MRDARTNRRLPTLVGILALAGCEVADLAPTPPEELDAHGPPSALVSGEDIEDAFAAEDGWLISPLLEAPEGATRAALMIDLRQDLMDEPVTVEARGLSEGHQGEWVAAEIVWQEAPFVVARAELGFVAEAIQVRVPAGHEELLAGLQYEAVIPEDQDAGASEPTLLAPGEAEQGLASDLKNLGVISRGAWNARRTRCTSQDSSKSRIAVHHTVTPPTYNNNYAARVRQIQAFHMDGRGWCDVGYHFLVTRDGRMWEGRPVHLLGSHVGNHNTDNVGVSFIGCFQPGACSGLGPSTAPEKMIEGGAKLIRRIAARYGISRTASRVKGHRDHSGASTSCPGDNVHSRLGALRNYTPPSTCSQVKRVKGDTRYQTAALVSQKHFANGARNVVIASGADGNPAAVVAGPLARKVRGPVLLTAKVSLPAATRAEIRRLGATKAFIVGSTGAVSQAVETRLENMGLTVERLGGANRYQVAANVARRTGSRDGIAFIVAGNNPIAGLSAAAAAASLRAPLLYVKKDAIPAATVAALAEIGVTRAFVVGGTGSISNAVKLALPNAARLVGSNRYQTSVAVANKARQLGAGTGLVYVSRGDVTRHGVLVGATGRLLLLSRTAGLPSVTSTFLERHANRARLLGGKGALSTAVQRSTCSALR